MNHSREFRNSDQLFRSTFDNMLEGCQIIGLDWKFIYINKAAEIQNRRPKQEFIGKGFKEVWPGIEETEVFRVIKRCMEENVSAHFETEFIFPDQSVGWYDLSIQQVPEGIFILSIDITTQKKTENQLRLINDRFSSIIDSNIVGIVIADPTGKVIEANDYYLNLIGYSRSEFEQGLVNWREITPPEWLFADEAAIKELRVKGICTPYEKEYIQRNGIRVSVYLSDTMLSGPEEQIAAFVLDITERKRAETTLRESEEKFAKAFQTSPYALSITRADDGKFLEINDNFCKITGYSKDEILASSSISLDMWANERNRQDVIKELQAGHSVSDKEFQFRTKNGKFIIALFSAQIIKLNGKNCILSSVNDITEHKQTLEALSESEKKLSEAQHMAQLGYWSWDILTGDVVWSDEMYRIFHLNPDHFIPRINSILDLSPWPEDHQRDQELIRKAVLSHEKGSYEQKFLRPDGTIGFYQSTFQGKYDNQDKLITIIGSVLDITERKEAEIALLNHMENYTKELEQHVAERTAELEATNRNLEAFAYSIAHDLRAPLRNIDGFTHILQEDYNSHLDDEGKRICTIISENAKSMGKLIDDLLTFARVGTIAIQQSRIETKKLVQNVFQELTTPERRQKINFHVDQLPNIKGDEPLIHQVWLNLISNAIKYSSKEDAPLIEVGVEESTSEIVFYVRDNGVGFDSLYIDKLFGVFQRLHTLQEFEGTGVGLAIVQRIIQRHGGRVWAEGNTNQGATFYFSLPKKS